MYTDSHCHLDFDADAAVQDEQVARARAAGVSRMVTIGSGRAGDGGVAAVAGARRLAERFEDVWFTAGVHPHDAPCWDDSSAGVIGEALKHPRCVAVGECGLDYFYEPESDAAAEACFVAQIGLARRARKPIVIHARDSRDGGRDPEGVARALELLEQHGAAEVGGVMHCFAGTMAQAERSMALGFYISISGIVTFKNAGALAEVAARVPDERLLIETDAPYLAPVPRRGKRNEPAYLVHTAGVVAELRGSTPEAVAELTSRNAAALFGLPTGS